jgi:hypothetical protein
MRQGPTMGIGRTLTPTTDSLIGFEHAGTGTEGIVTGGTGKERTGTKTARIEGTGTEGTGKERTGTKTTRIEGTGTEGIVTEGTGKERAGTETIKIE